MFSDLPASRIVELHRKEAVVNNDNHHQLPAVPSKASKFSSGVSIVSMHLVFHCLVFTNVIIFSS
jgi:hypothetical protein